MAQAEHPESQPPSGLTDDSLTQPPPSRSVRGYLRDAVDRLIGADPGLNQLRLALQAVLAISVAIVLVEVFVHVTGALQLSPGQASARVVAIHNHALLVVSMLLAGMVALLACFTVNDRTARGQLLTTLMLPIPMLAALATGILIGKYRLASLVFLVLLLTAAVYVRRFGPRGFAFGMVAFNGGFLGFFLHALLALRDLGWLAADLAVGVVASLLVRFLFFRPSPEATLDRMRRSWQSRARQLVAASAAVVMSAGEAELAAGQRLLQRLVIRLNESTLMIDAQLAEAFPEYASRQSQRLFDAELALTNCARFATALARLDAPAALRVHARDALASLNGAQPAVGTAALREWADENPRVTVLAHRLGASIDGFAAALAGLDAAVERRRSGLADQDGSGAAYQPVVSLDAGHLPGSVPVSAAASMTPGRGGRLDRVTLPPYLRSSIQIFVAATLAVLVGDTLSPGRLYWAVLATFLAFIATTNSGEQARKAVFRVAGTAIGIVIGDLLVHATGGQVWPSLVFVLVSLFFGIYLIRVNYTFMVIGITVTMSLLYAQLGEFSWRLLLLRLEETAIGVGAVIVTVLVIVPLRPQRVLTTGVLMWFRSLTEVIDLALGRLLGERGPGTMLPAVRALDADYAALESTAQALRHTTFGRNSTQLASIRALSAAARTYARSLAVQADIAARAGQGEVPQLRPAAAQLDESMSAIEVRIETGRHGRYVRCASLVDAAVSALPPGHVAARLALRDLALLDGTLARLAAVLQMEVTAWDTESAQAGLPPLENKAAQP